MLNTQIEIRRAVVTLSFNLNNDMVSQFEIRGGGMAAAEAAWPKGIATSTTRWWFVNSFSVLKKERV
jgi:hypothetical protein